jgi:hypothetical protein
LQRAQEGDESTLPVLRAWLDGAPSLIDECGNIAERAESAWVGLVCGKNLLLSEALSRKLAALRLELGGPNPAPLERLLVERIAVCWLHVHYADANTAQSAGNATRGWAEFHLKRQESAQRRYLSAIKALAQVRRLLTPSIQVNIAEQQVNVAATGAVGR